MPGQLSNAVKESRSKAAIAVAREMELAFLQDLVDSVQNVLFEETEDGFYTGHAPNYVKVYVRGEDLHNKILPVRITGFRKDGLLGELV
jgi:tRNA A37 methylthiotransferase MiaB